MKPSSSNATRRRLSSGRTLGVVQGKTIRGLAVEELRRQVSPCDQASNKRGMNSDRDQPVAADRPKVDLLPGVRSHDLMISDPLAVEKDRCRLADDARKDDRLPGGRAADQQSWIAVRVAELDLAGVDRPGAAVKRSRSQAVTARSPSESLECSSRPGRGTRGRDANRAGTEMPSAGRRVRLALFG